MPIGYGIYNNETKESIAGVLPSDEKIRENLEKAFIPFNVRAEVTLVKKPKDEAAI